MTNAKQPVNGYCSVCTRKIMASIKKFNCSNPECTSIICVKCKILQIIANPDCLPNCATCGTQFDAVHLYTNLPRSFILQVYKPMRRKTIVNHYRSQLDDMRPVVELKNAVNRLHQIAEAYEHVYSDAQYQKTVTNIYKRNFTEYNEHDTISLVNVVYNALTNIALYFNNQVNICKFYPALANAKLANVNRLIDLMTGLGDRNLIRNMNEQQLRTIADTIASYKDTIDTTTDFAASQNNDCDRICYGFSIGLGPITNSKSPDNVLDNLPEYNGELFEKMVNCLIEPSDIRCLFEQHIQDDPEMTIRKYKCHLETVAMTAYKYNKYHTQMHGCYKLIHEMMMLIEHHEKNVAKSTIISDDAELNDYIKTHPQTYFDRNINQHKFDLLSGAIDEDAFELRIYEETIQKKAIEELAKIFVNNMPAMITQLNRVIALFNDNKQLFSPEFGASNDTHSQRANLSRLTRRLFKVFETKLVRNRLYSKLNAYKVVDCYVEYTGNDFNTIDEFVALYKRCRPQMPFSAYDAVFANIEQALGEFDGLIKRVRTEAGVILDIYSTNKFYFGYTHTCPTSCDDVLLEDYKIKTLVRSMDFRRNNKVELPFSVNSDVLDKNTLEYYRRYTSFDVIDWGDKSADEDTGCGELVATRQTIDQIKTWRDLNDFVHSRGNILLAFGENMMSKTISRQLPSLYDVLMLKPEPYLSLFDYDFIDGNANGLLRFNSCLNKPMNYDNINTNYIVQMDTKNEIMVVATIKSRAKPEEPDVAKRLAIGHDCTNFVAKRHQPMRTYLTCRTNSSVFYIYKSRIYPQHAFNYPNGNSATSRFVECANAFINP